MATDNMDTDTFSLSSDSSNNSCASDCSAHDEEDANEHRPNMSSLDQQHEQQQNQKQKQMPISIKQMPIGKEEVETTMDTDSRSFSGSIAMEMSPVLLGSIGKFQDESQAMRSDRFNMSCESICDVIEIGPGKHHNPGPKEIINQPIEMEEYDDEGEGDNDTSFVREKYLSRLKDVLDQRKSSMLDLTKSPPPTIDQIMTQAQEKKRRRKKSMRNQRHSISELSLSSLMKAANMPQLLPQETGKSPSWNSRWRQSVPPQQHNRSPLELEKLPSFLQYHGKKSTSPADVRKERRRSITKPRILDKNQFISPYSPVSQRPVSILLPSKPLESGGQSFLVSKFGTLNEAFESELAQLEALTEETTEEERDRKHKALAESIVNAAGLLALAKDQITKANEENATMKRRSMRLESLLEEALESKSEESIEKEELKSNYNRLNEHLQGMRRKFLSAVVAHSQRRQLQAENMELRKELSAMRKEMAALKAKRKCCTIM